MASAPKVDGHTKRAAGIHALRLPCDCHRSGHLRSLHLKKIILKPPWRANPNVLCTHTNFGMCEFDGFFGKQRIGRRLKLQELHPYDGRAGREHGNRGKAAEHHPARRFKDNRGT